MVIKFEIVRLISNLLEESESQKYAARKSPVWSTTKKSGHKSLFPWSELIRQKLDMGTMVQGY